MNYGAVRFGVTIGMLSITLAVAKIHSRRESSGLAQPLSTIPATVGEWTATDDPVLPNRLQDSLAATSHIGRTYRAGDRQVHLFVAFYANQRAGESMHSPKYCLLGGGWEALDSGLVEVRAGGQSYNVNRYLLYNAGQRTVVLYWYQNRARILASEYLGKAYLAWDALARGDTSGSIVRITVADRPEALQDAIRFSSWVIPHVGACFDKRAVTP
ncbi:MAG: exosortase C-terminal domain/associated protein EpsI [Bryobacteraceae bacterium]